MNLMTKLVSPSSSDSCSRTLRNIDGVVVKYLTFVENPGINDIDFQSQHMKDVVSDAGSMYVDLCYVSRHLVDSGPNE